VRGRTGIEGACCVVGSAIGGVFTLGVFAAVGLSFYRLGYEARSGTIQVLAVAALFIVICAFAGILH
jgi:hypothetical protein